ncbi:MAG: helix-turn-helix transcriptional regulator [Candidatus Obscuribacterales bacterium]|jgi:transcriptional regulator with XRE-family HTH domain
MKSENFSIKPLLEALTMARKFRGIKQKDLAKKLDVPQSYVSKIESGNTDIRTSKLIEMARLLRFELMLIPVEFAPQVEALISPNSLDDEPLYQITTEDTELDDD